MSKHTRKNNKKIKKNKTKKTTSKKVPHHDVLLEGKKIPKMFHHPEVL